MNEKQPEPMTPGHVNGVRCIWPEARDSTPRPSARIGRPPADECLRGHVAGRYKNGVCKECRRMLSREWARKKAKERA